MIKREREKEATTDFIFSTNEWLKCSTHDNFQEKKVIIGTSERDRDSHSDT